jgi:hypothetical protein
VDLVRTLKGSRWQIFTKIQLPGALPSIFSGMKVGAILAVAGTIVGDFLGSDRGLGYLMLQVQVTLDTAAMFMAVILITIIGVVLYGLVLGLERLLVVHEDARAVWRVHAPRLPAARDGVGRTHRRKTQPAPLPAIHSANGKEVERPCLLPTRQGKRSAAASSDGFASCRARRRTPAGYCSTSRVPVAVQRAKSAEPARLRDT